MKAAAGCLFWLALYAFAALALAFVVERRIGERVPALVAGAVAGALVTVALSHLLTVGRKVGELMLIRRARSGAEPEDGKRFAAIGPITPDRLGTVIPALIRCGVQQVRVLAGSDEKSPQGSAKQGDLVCAFGRYSMDRRALLLEGPVESAEGLVARRAGAIGGAIMNSVVILAIVTAALAGFLAVVPLDFAEGRIAGVSPSWLEIGAEDWVESNLRMPLHQAGMPVFFDPQPGEGLEAGEARGRMRSEDREVIVTRATVDWWHDHLAIRFYGESEFAGGIMVAPPGVLRGLNILSRDVDAETAPHSKLAFRGIGRDEVAGRVTLVKDGIPLCRVVFRVRVPPPGSAI